MTKTEQKELPEVTMNVVWQKLKENPVVCVLTADFLEGPTHLCFSKTTSSGSSLRSWRRNRHRETLLYEPGRE